jgi:hypothetical protein
MHLNRNPEMDAVRLAQLNLDRVSLLMFNDLQSAAPNMPATGRDPSLNLVLIPGLNPDIGVMRVHSQLGFPRKVINLGPIVGMRSSAKRKRKNQQV